MANLTKEDKKEIAKAVTEMMQAFCEFKLAENRLNMMNDCVHKNLNMGFTNEMADAAMAPFAKSLEKTTNEYFKVLGVDEDDTEFWEYQRELWTKGTEDAKADNEKGGVEQ